MEVRPAAAKDAVAICALVNPVIRDTLITFTTVERTPEDITQAMDMGTPFWVWEGAQGLSGYASYAPFRTGPGYARTMEHSIILAPSAWGQGGGRALIAAVAEHATAAGAGSLIGAVSGTNAKGLAFHKRVGFEQVGLIPQAGFKFGQWVDLVLLQKRLLPDGPAG